MGYNGFVNKKTVTLIGTFRRNKEDLRKIFSDLSEGFDLICPLSIDFVDDEATFVKAEHEIEDSTSVIERRVLDAIRKSDFVWLFAPQGYVGLSASFEIGFAHSLGVPVFSDTAVQDEMLQTMITGVITNPTDANASLCEPGYGISGLQRYYERISRRRGWVNESPKDIMILLTEEMGELARAIRKSEGLKRDAGYSGINLEDELADVQLYLVHLASSVKVELSHAVKQKEKKNSERYEEKKITSQ